MMRTKQFAGLKEDRMWAAKTNMKSRIRAAEDNARRNARRLVMGHYDPGTLVIVYQAQFDVNAKFQGAKYRERWAGPYRVTACLPSGSYRLMELDGSPMKGTVAANRVKLFYSREHKSYTKQLDELSESDSLDEEEINQIVQNDPDEYLPSYIAHRSLDPNLLTNYRPLPPNWEEIWERWKKRSLEQAKIDKLTKETE